MELKDYRPVAIFPVFFLKVYEKLVLNQLTAFIEEE